MAVENIPSLENMIADSLGVSGEVAIFILLIISVWSLIWMGIALWKAASKKQIAWFVVFLIFHTVGILEILYIFIFSKMGEKSKGPKKIKDIKPNKKNSNPKKKK